MRRREYGASKATRSCTRQAEQQASRTSPEAVVFLPGSAAARCASLDAPLYCDGPSACDRPGRI